MKRILIAAATILAANALTITQAKADAWLIVPAGYYDRSQWQPTHIYHYAEHPWQPYSAATRCRMDLERTPVTALCTVDYATALLFRRY